MPTQIARLKRFAVDRSVDAHVHCLPGVDDGPATIEEAIELCRALVRDGFTDAIATPHQLGRYDQYNWAHEVRGAVEQMQATLDQQRVPLTLHAGAEVRVDERIPSLLQSDRVLTLADRGRYLLLELPTNAAVAPQAVQNVLGACGVTIVLAHAERYESLRRDPPAAMGWLEIGAVLQVNASSLLADKLPGEREAAEYWIEQGWISLVASDAHNLDVRRPRMGDAIDALEGTFGHEIARRLCVVNPLKLLDATEKPNEARSG